MFPMPIRELHQSPCRSRTAFVCERVRSPLRPKTSRRRGAPHSLHRIMANHNLRKILALTASALALALAGCGGGGDDDDPPTPVALGGSFTGLAFKGPIHGAAVCAYVIDNGASDRR